MKFAGFDRSALEQLERLPSLGFQVRFRIPLPRKVERPEFAPWCAEHLSELLPTHRWLVTHLFMEDDAG